MTRTLPIALLACLAPLSPAQDEALPIRFVDAFPGQEKFDKPLFLDHHATDPDHYYVVEQSGRVFRIPRDGDNGDRHLFLDLREKCFTENWEEGLLGFAFDPGFAENGQVYVYYSEKTGEKEVRRRGRVRKVATRQSVIARLDTTRTDTGPQAVVESELRVMEIPQPYGNHNGGTIVFGPDGMLYVALGDGGLANDPHANGQDKGTILGTVLRIDVRGAAADERYRIPADNPFAGEDGARGEIWCYGLRNPWRISFDRKTGDLWCGDVGQDRIEEVDRLVKGGNYGWNLMEGDEKFQSRPQRDGDYSQELIGPVAIYARKDGISITGGYVYRGAGIPDLHGRFVYGDFDSRRTWAVAEDRAGGAHDVRYLGFAPGKISSFAEEPDGELLVLCLYQGRIHRIVAAKRGR